MYFCLLLVIPHLQVAIDMRSEARSQVKMLEDSVSHKCLLAAMVRLRWEAIYVCMHVLVGSEGCPLPRGSLTGFGIVPVV